MFSKNDTKHLGLGLLIGLVVIIIVTIITTDDADAKGLPHGGDIPIWDESTHPPRVEVRLNWMGRWSDQVKSNLSGVLYDALEKENKPFYLYFGLQFGVIEPVIGYSFRDQEWVIGLRLYPEWETWRGYSNLEYQSETQSYYYLAQLETRLGSFIEAGFEAEGWGDIDDHRNSDGVGINLIFNLRGLSRYKAQDSKLRVEVFVQLREMGDEYKPQFGIRFDFTPKPKEHTPDRRERRGGRY